jgi:hypothetical protein
MCQFPLKVKKSFLIVYDHHNIDPINGWSSWKIMKFGRSYMLRFKVHLAHFYVANL